MKILKFDYMGAVWYTDDMSMRISADNTELYQTQSLEINLEFLSCIVDSVYLRVMLAVWRKASAIIDHETRCI